MRTLFCFFLVLLPAAGLAQVAEVDSDSLRTRYEQNESRIQRLTETIPGLAAEDSAVVMNELELALIDAARILGDLAGAIVDEADSGVVLTDSLTIDEYWRFHDRLWVVDSNVTVRLRAARKAVDGAEGKARDRLERELALREKRLDTVHRLMQKHIEAMDRLGMDVAAARERLGDHLVTRADLLVGRTRVMQAQLKWLQNRARRNPGDAELKEEVELISARVGLYAQSLREAATGLHELDRNAVTYDRFLVEHTDELSRGVLDLSVLAGLVAAWWHQAGDWLDRNGFPVAMKTGVFLAIMFVFWLVSRVVQRGLERALDGPRVNVSNLLRRMLVGLSGNLVLLAGFLVALSQTGFDLAPVLAGVGVVGFIVGFALQDTLANFAAGVMILIYRPYDVGDTVEAGGVFGKVSHMSLVSTTILTFDNQTLVVPNGKIWGDVIRNVTAQRLRRVDLEFGISYSDDIPKAERVLSEILEAHQAVLKSPEPIVKLAKLNESSVDFIVRPWVHTTDYWDVFWDITREVKIRFDAEGISIPFPQRDVHHHYVDGAPAPPSRPAASAGGAEPSRGGGQEVEDGATPES